MARDINITVTNETNAFQNIVIFQQKDDLNQMFDNLWPIAWKVFPLNPPSAGQTKKGSTVYPAQQSIGVTRTPASTDQLPMGVLDITQLCDNGEKYKYLIDNNGAQEIEKLSGTNADASVSCTNDTGDLVSIAFCKQGATLVMQTDVANGDSAYFKLTPKLYFMYLNNIKEGDIFKSMQRGENVNEVDLTGYSQITARLMIDPNATGLKKMWVIEKR